MDLAKGEAEVFPEARKPFDPASIPKAVKDAGFTAAGVTVTVDGVLVKGEVFLELDVPGLDHRFVLAGGRLSETLSERGDLLGMKIRVNGILHPNHGDHPPGLTLEDFKKLP